MKKIYFLAIFTTLLSFSALADTQIYRCSGQKIDDNGYRAGQISGTLKIFNPKTVKDLLENSRSKEFSRTVAEKYFLIEGGSTINARQDKSWIGTSVNFGSYVRTFWVKSNSLGKSGKGIEGQITDSSGVGTEGGDVSCTSTIE